MAQGVPRVHVTENIPTRKRNTSYVRDDNDTKPFKKAKSTLSPRARRYSHNTQYTHTVCAYTSQTAVYTHTVYTDTDNTRRGCDRPEFKETEADYTKACKDYITQQATLMRS
jgi:hypothetical protein